MNKIDSNYTLTEIEAFEILDVVRMFESNQHIVLEKICYTLPKIKIDSTDFFKLELIICMDCVIHMYAKTVEDIKRLEKVINLPNANTARKFFEDRLFNDGMTEGRLEMAASFVDRFGLDAVAEVSGFSREELLKAKLSK